MICLIWIPPVNFITFLPSFLHYLCQKWRNLQCTWGLVCETVCMCGFAWLEMYVFVDLHDWYVSVCIFVWLRCVCICRTEICVCWCMCVCVTLLQYRVFFNPAGINSMRMKNLLFNMLSCIPCYSKCWHYL